MNKRRVVITGLGVVAPNGTDTRTFWQNIVEGKSGVKRITSFDTSDYPCKIAGEITGFDAAPYFEDSKSARRADRFSQFAMAASAMALEDSGIDMEKVDRDRFGVIIGTGIGGLITMEEAARKLIEGGPRKVSPFSIPGMMGNAASSLVSIAHDLRGPNLCIVTACATGGNSVGEAWRSILYGDADIFLAGGSEATVSPLGVAGFSSMRALSLRNDEPEKACRPFDRDRDGFVMGEGAGVLVLEELEHALKRGATIYCEITGYGCTADAYHMTHPHPEGRSVAQAMKIALDHAGVDASQVDYVNAHATSTPIGDACEAAAIKAALGENAKRVAISSTKSMTGHLLGAAGGVELAICALAIRDKVVPPTINLDNPDPACDLGLDLVPNVARKADVKIAMNNSFGFGGHNTSIVVTEYAG